MFSTILIANRGEIACRVIRTARRLGIRTVAVFSEADADARHVRLADEAHCIGGPRPQDSYLRGDAILEVASRTGAQAIHPGYGFLSENADFADAVAAAGIAFIGPSGNSMRKMGSKAGAKDLMAAAGVPVVPGYTGEDQSPDLLQREADRIGYPLMIKAAHGGGGKGMRIAWNDQEAREGFESSKNEAANSFGDDRIFIEKFVTQPRHIEIQVLADKHGNCVYLHERECSIQRRNQKVIEEAPSPFLDAATRKAMGEQACALAKAVGYTSAGTVEFIVDADKNFYFLEMNTRLQVEHPVTELITGVDLVEQMIRVAGGEPLPFAQDDLTINGWAIESRLYAEDPYRNFLPSIGRLTRYRPPAETAAGPLLDADRWVPARPGDHPPAAAAGVRNDTGVYEGGEISMYYDPMIAKLCTWAPTREAAIEQMRLALDEFEVEGIGHNLPFLSAVMDHPKFVSGDISTAFIAEEYPEGFLGATLPEAEIQRIAASVAAMHRVAEIRRTRISGRLDNHERHVGEHWVVTVAGQEFPVRITADKQGSTVEIAGRKLRVESDWLPGQSLARLSVDGSPLVLKVDRLPSGFRLRVRGADLKTYVRRPRAAELARLMPEKLPPDTSKFLLCPMPGLVVKVNVAAGDEVQEGQALATVEAMKMENILRAERRGVVKSVNASAGESLKVDDVIMEFE